MTELVPTSLAREVAAPQTEDAEDDAAALLPTAAGERAPPGSLGTRLLRVVGRLRKLAQDEPLLVQTLIGARS